MNFETVKGQATRLMLGLLALALGGLGCGGSTTGVGFAAAGSLGPVALAASVAYVDPAAARALVIDPAARTLAARAVPIGKRPAQAVRRLGHDELLVLSRGERGDTGLAPEDPSLVVVPADAAQAPRRFPVGSRFDALAQSPDGRFAVLFFSQAAGVDEQASLLVNPNEVEVVDLDGPIPATGGGRTLRSFGAVPRAVLFAPPLTLQTTPPRTLQLAVVLSDSYVTLFDLEHQERTEITVSLAAADAPQTVTPLQLAFDTTDPKQDPTVFIRSDGSTDVVALRLSPTALPLADKANDFHPVLSLLGTGDQPSDMALYPDTDGPRLLLLLPKRQQLAVLDPRTSRATTVALPAPAERLVLFNAAAPSEPQSRPRALLLADSGGEVAFLDLEGLEAGGTRNIELRPMAAAAHDFLPLTDRGVVIAEHSPSSGGVGLSVIDLARRTVSPLVGEPISGLAPAPLPGDEVWLAPSAASRVGLLHLGSLAADEVRLDQAVSAVLPLGPSADGHRYVVVDHGRGDGDITVLDADAPTRKTARSLIGFFYTDLLSRGDR